MGQKEKHFMLENALQTLLDASQILDTGRFVFLDYRFDAQI